MKFVAALQIMSLMGVSSVSAFMGPAPVARFGRNALPVSATPVAEAEAKQPMSIEEDTVVIEDPTPAPEEEDPRMRISPGRYDNIDYSITLPFLQRPPALDGSHAGDYGFDPCGFSEDYDLYYMQECELRHARLAMLAVVGWPLSELVAPKWMLQDGCAPSVLNGFNPLSFIGVAAAFAAFGFLEYSTALRRNTETKLGDKHASDMSEVWKYGVAGDYNFDPANFYSLLGDDAAGRKGLRTLEVTQGRYAMLGITYFALYESLTGSPIVQSSMFFHPNAMLPLLGISYFAWTQFYQVSDLRKTPVKIEYTKDGEEMLRGVERQVDVLKNDAGKFAKAQGFDKQIDDLTGKATTFVNEKMNNYD